MNLRKQEPDEGTNQKDPPSPKNEKRWQRTNTSNLLRHGPSGIYYARLYVNGKEKWRSLKTSLPSVAKDKLADVAEKIRAKGKSANAEDMTTGKDETTVGRFMTIYLQRTENDSSLKPRSKSRRDIAMKALCKTWPDLAIRDAQRVTAKDCKEWASRALREGTKFVAPGAKTKRKGMSAGAFNKTVDVLRATFAIAEEFGVVYENPATDVKKAKMTQRRLELPSVEQFQAILRSIATAGARQSKDCHDMARLLAYSGMRLGEATALQWKHVDFKAPLGLTVPGTKTPDSWRTIPLFPPLRELLKEIQAARGHEAAETFVLRVKECKGALRSACKVVGVKVIAHHDLRHLFATRCIELGVDIPTVSRWLGHSDGGALAMKTYGHLRNQHSTEQAARINFDGGKAS